MRAIAATFPAASDVADARAELGALVPSPGAMAGGVLGAAGRQEDGAILLAIHIDDDRVQLVRAIAETHHGTVIDVIELRT
jgi:hypothetical protein